MPITLDGDDEFDDEDEVEPIDHDAELEDLVEELANGAEDGSAEIELAYDFHYDIDEEDEEDEDDMDYDALEENEQGDD